MELAILTEGRWREWFAEYNGITFCIWESYLWDDKGHWHYYYVIDDMDDKGMYFRQLAKSPMTPELATRLCKKALKSVALPNGRQRRLRINQLITSICIDFTKRPIKR